LLFIIYCTSKYRDYIDYHITEVMLIIRSHTFDYHIAAIMSSIYI